MSVLCLFLCIFFHVLSFGPYLCSLQYILHLKLNKILCTWCYVTKVLFNLFGLYISDHHIYFFLFTHLYTNYTCFSSMCPLTGQKDSIIAVVFWHQNMSAVTLFEHYMQHTIITKKLLIHLCPWTWFWVLSCSKTQHYCLC